MDEKAAALFRTQLASFQAVDNGSRRIVPLFAGGITFADRESLQRAVALGREMKLPRTALYETVLQSYLFLGFPRMLFAMDELNRVWPETMPIGADTVSSEEAAAWHERGIRLYQRVYASNHATLKERVEQMSPEIFRWMIVEGYGKVLSRPELAIIERELAIVAMLMIEAREPQLHSHIRGALNVGATRDDVRAVIDDIGPAAGAGESMARRILEKVAG